MTVSGTVLMQHARPGERGRIMALYQGSLLLGGGIGPGIGGFLAEHFGFAAPFWALFAVAAAALAFALTTFVEPPATEHPGGKPNMFASVGSLLKLAPYLLLCVVTFGVFFTRTASMWVLIPLVAHESFGLSVDLIGAALSLSALANFAMLPIAGPAIDRLGSRPITIVSTILTGLGLAILGLTTGVVWFWAAIVILGIGNSFGGPSVGAAMAEVVPANLYGPAMGLQRMIGDVAFVAGPIVVGLLSDIAWIGNTGGLIANALLMIGAGAVFAAGSRGVRKAGAT
jgi:MFS family permease